MCGRYYVDDDTIREIEKIVRHVEQKLCRETGTGDIFPTSRAPVIVGKEAEFAEELFGSGMIKRLSSLMPGRRRLWKSGCFGIVFWSEDVWFPPGISMNGMHIRINIPFIGRMGKFCSLQDSIICMTDRNAL